MTEGYKLIDPVQATVFDATFGTPVLVEYWLTKDSETSFFDNVLSVNMTLDSDSQLGKFLSLHPWFCQHIVFVWKEKGKTSNVLIESFRYMLMIGQGKSTLINIKLRAIPTLLACEIIEEARQTIESYDGIGAGDLKDRYDARAKQYFNP